MYSTTFQNHSLFLPSEMVFRRKTNKKELLPPIHKKKINCHTILYLMCPDFLFPGIRINSSPYGKYNIICFLFFQVFWNIFPYQRSVNACISSLVTVSFVPPPPIFFEFNCIIRAIPCLFVDFLLKSFNFSVSTYRLCGFLTACADSLVFSLPTFYDKCIHREF